MREGEGVDGPTKMRRYMRMFIQLCSPRTNYNNIDRKTTDWFDCAQNIKKSTSRLFLTDVPKLPRSVNGADLEQFD